jgi:2-(1,2-epoxy-1,2-dihydrophenyl)acetyl-CoA isomerase
METQSKETGPILLNIRGTVAKITFNRPEKMNSINLEMIIAFNELLDACRAPEIRCVCIEGSGGAFCTGQDLAEVVASGGKGMEGLVTQYYNPVIQKIRQLDKPVIALVNGPAAGAGANIALSCDIVVASSTAYFLQAFSKIGLIPDCGGTYSLPRLIGWQRASALMILAEKVTAEEAEQLGIVYKVFSNDTFAAQGEALAEHVATLPTAALAFLKQALNQSAGNTLEQQLALEAELQLKAQKTADFEEGVRAFIEKRKPVYAGH